MTNALQASNPVKRSRNRDFLYFFCSTILRSSDRKPPQRETFCKISAVKFSEFDRRD
ncbi:MAG: hypothetical protein ACMG55_12380 [Microcoleus sp.]